ncbi:22150_t:CDS:2 [Cetraspora pellucida]|uniref:22150_t:CDS:1 n=1 Tax=Cetraspora pellucida TaxID=1433469 RepID=A0A9N9F3Y1_9GLOM|nr:22150_t:CDS:2 [Cetraspora pellucida]
MSQKSKNKIASSPEKSPSSAGERSEGMLNYLLNFDKQGPTIANEENNDVNYRKNIKVHIYQAREDKIRLPQNYGSDEDDFFNNYEEENIKKEDVYSPAIYLTTLEEIPTPEEPMKEIPRNKNHSQNPENPGYNTEENEKYWTEKENYYCNTVNEWLEDEKTLIFKEPGKANRAKFTKKQLKLPYWKLHHEQTQAAQIPTVYEKDINPTSCKNLNEFVSWRTRDRSYAETEKFWASIGNYYYDSEVDDMNDDDDNKYETDEEETQDEYGKEPITTSNEYWQDSYEEAPNTQEMYDLERMKEFNTNDYKTVRPNIPPSDQEFCETWTIIQQIYKLENDLPQARDQALRKIKTQQQKQKENYDCYLKATPTSVLVTRYSLMMQRE